MQSDTKKHFMLSGIMLNVIMLSVMGPFMVPSSQGFVPDSIGATTLSIMTLSIMTLSIMTLSIMTLSIMTLSIMTFSILTNNTQHNGFSY